MPRRKDIDPKRHVHTTIPRPLSDRLDLFLFSELEGRVPQGALQEFLIDRIQTFFDHRTLDLAPYLNCEPGIHLVQAPVETLRAIQILFINAQGEQNEAKSSETM